MTRARTENMQSGSPQSQPEALAITQSEAYQTLLARARRRTGGLPAERIVRHVLSITQGGDWPIQRDALDAVLRRCASTHTDEIQIVGRPRGLLGLYATRRLGSRARPYRTLLRRLDPLDGSCDCADFLRNSLGLCKHIVAVLEDVVSKRHRVDIQREEAPAVAPLRWDPVRPLTGPGDWLARVRWADGVPDRALRRWLRSANGHGWTAAIPERLQQRLMFVDRLLRVLSDGNSEPALHALLRQERAHLAHQVQTVRTLKGLHRALHTLKQLLYPYQRDGVERFFVRGRLLLADDMGLGKTAQAIAACHALWHAGRVHRGLIVVPAALKQQWLREWQIFTDAPASAAPRSRLVGADSFWATTSSSCATLTSFADGRLISSC
jgi:hypothetical protein